MKFSIIMPVYNVEEYVEKSIRSVLNQTYKNFELIIVNDGTTDNSMKIVSEFQKKDKRIKAYNKKNGGLSSARNYGLKYATGEYICFIDSDDYIENNFLYTLNQELLEQKYDLIIFGYSIDKVDNEDKIIEENDVVEKLQKFNRLKKDKLQFENISTIGYAWNKCYKHEIIKNNNLLYEEGTSYIEDIIFNCNFIKNSNTIKIIQEALYHYIQRERETLGRKSYNNMLQLDLRYSQQLKGILSSVNYSKKEINKTTYQTLFDRFKWSINIVTMDKSISKNKRISIIKKYFLYLKENYKKISSHVIFNKKDQIFMFFAQNNLSRIFYRINRIFFFFKDKYKRIKKNVPNNIKDKIKYYLSSSKGIKELDSQKQKIIVFLGADYGNLGDVAITESQVNFLKNNFPNREVIEIPISSTYTSLKSVKKHLKKGDIVTLIGGGNISDLYEDIEHQRRFIIKKLRKYPIISFPQTIYFTNTKQGNKSKHKTINAYRKHPKLYLFAREEKTYKFLKQYFKSDKIFLCPDIVLSKSLQISNKNKKSEKIVFCIRSDKESALSKPKLENIINNIKTNEIIFTDTQINKNNMTIETRKKELNKIINLFSESKLVITDRLHGMILCAITNTPCLAIDNSNGKVSGVYEKWLKEKSSIRLVKPDEITNEMIEETMNLKEKYILSQEDFQKLIDVLGE